jgi:dTDP-4-amino-4,6-dideoxygalactose transaminase
MGEETIAFEKELADFVGAPNVVSVNSCTSALFLSLVACGIQPEDEVIVPSLTWYATANAALYLGAVPVFADIDRATLSVSIETILSKVTDKTRAVTIVHYGGLAFDVFALRKALPEHIAIIEDAAHALGAQYANGQAVGSSGNLVCFSFYANKNLSTADGGAIALFNDETADQLRSLRMGGISSSAWSRYTNPASAFTTGVNALGYKMNFTDLCAALGRVQLSRMHDMVEKRLRLAHRYQRLLADSEFEIPFQTGVFEVGHARHLLVGEFDHHRLGLSRNELVLKLRSRNIGASVHYLPIHLQPFYEKFGRGSLPNTELVADRILTLPIGAKMNEADVDYVCCHLFDILRRQARV